MKKFLHLPKEWFVTQGLLLVLGLLLIFIAFLIQGQTLLSLVLFGLATSMMAAISLSIIENILGAGIPTIVQESLIFNKKVYDEGLEAVYPRSSDDDAIFRMFETAHSIDMLYNTAKNECYQYGLRIQYAIQSQGCEVRIAIADRENGIWDRPELSDGLSPGTNVCGELTDTETYMRRIIDGLSSTRGSFELRKYKFVPTGSITIVDKKIVRHVPYLAYRHSVEVPAYYITKDRGKRLYQQYEDAFERAWNTSEVIFKKHWP